MLKIGYTSLINHNNNLPCFRTRVYLHLGKVFPWLSLDSKNDWFVGLSGVADRAGQARLYWAGRW